MRAGDGIHTRKGRVVYDRKRHVWKLRDLKRIMDSITESDEVLFLEVPGTWVIAFVEAFLRILFKEVLIRLLDRLTGGQIVSLTLEVLAIVQRAFRDFLLRLGVEAGEAVGDRGEE